jgi:hypothetical protein
MPKHTYLNFQYLSRALLVFFVFICCFTTTRLLLFGSQPFANFIELIVTILPDVFLALLIIYSALLIYKKYKSSLTPFRFNMFDWVVVIFILLNFIIGTIVSSDLVISFRGFRITYLPVLFYFIGRFLWDNNQEQFLKIIDKIFLCFTALGIIGLIIYFISPSIETKMIDLAGYGQATYFIKRMTSILWTPVLFGTLMSLTSVYLFYKILSENKLIHYLFLAIVYTCLFLSVSRGPIIAALIGYCVVFYFNRKWQSLFFVSLIFISLSILISFYATGDFRFLAWIFKSTYQTLAMENGITRVDRWSKSYIDLSERPFGYGLGKAGATAFRFFKDGKVSAAPLSTDGWYLKLKNETGIIGYLTYALILFFYLIYGLKKLFKDNKNIAVLAFAFFIMVNAQNVVCNTLDFYPFIILYWIFIGISTNYFFKLSFVKK